MVLYMKKEIVKKKVRVQDMLEMEKKLLSAQELKLIKKLTKRDKNEKFERCLG